MATGTGAVLASLDTGGGVTPSGGDISGELGSLLGDAFDSASGTEETPNTSSPVADQTSVADGPPEDSAIDTVSEQPAHDQVGTPEDSAYGLSPDGKFYQVPKQDFPRLQTARQFQEAVSQWFQTPQEAQAAYLQAADLRTMSNDWMYGSDDSVRSVLNHFAGANHAGNPAVQQKYQQSFAKMASAMPSMLQKINPQAYQTMEQGIISTRIENAYRKAAETGNPDDFQRAQELDYGVTGTYKQELPKIDPRAAQQTDLERQMAEFNQRQTAAMARDVRGFNDSALEGAKFTQLNSLIDSQLGKIKDRYTDIAYQDIRNGVKADLVARLQSMPEFWTEHQQTWNQLIADYKTSWQQGSPGNGLQPRTQAYIQGFLNQAKRILPSVAKPRIEAATRTPGTARASNGQFAATNGQPQSRPATAQPVTAANGKPPDGRMKSDQWEKEWGDMFRSL